MILPERVFGRSAEKRMSSGRASEPIFLQTNSRSSSRSAGVAVVAQPQRHERGDGLSLEVVRPCPTTAASATAGCSTSADSTSMVPMRCPATLSTSSTRPRIQK